MANALIPENDQQELWEMNGRREALRAFLKRQKLRNPEVSVSIVEAIMGFEEEIKTECRRCGHPAEEES